jgi:hypothetical protein
MDLLTLANSGAADFLAAFSPTTRDLLSFVRKHEDLIRRVIPVVQAAAKEGPAVIDAVQKNAPELVAAVKEMIGASASARENFGSTQLDPAPEHEEGVQLENALRSIAGVPRMTAATERAWMDRTAGNDPSQENSRQGGA